MRTLLSAFLLAGAAVLPMQARAQGAPAQTIEITLSNFKFTPKTLSLHHGQAYRLHFVNDSSGGHDFDAPAFFADADIDPADAAAIHEGKVEVAKGQTRDVLLTPRKAGAYEVKCSHMMHATMGMRGDITVD